MATEKSSRSGKSFKVDFVLNDKRPDEDAPDIALYQLDRRGKVEKKLAVAQEGKVTLEEAWQEKALHLAIGPNVEQVSDLRGVRLLKVRAAQVWPDWKAHKVIEIPQQIWPNWQWYRTCLSGEVRRCVTLTLAPPDPIPIPFPGPPVLIPPFPPFTICRPVCDGVVEVYARECCCEPPLVVDPTRWPEDLCERFPEICLQLPPIPDPIPDPIPWPDPGPGPFPGPTPGPGPDPVPFADPRTAKRIKLAEATTDRAIYQPVSRRLLNDLRALRQLPSVEIEQFLLDRPYLCHLWCVCNSRKIGETALNPDGSFNFCYWRSGLIRWPAVCTTTYAFKVKQWNVNQWVEIYDGVAAHEYFSANELADISTYHPKARWCTNPEEPEVDHDKPFVLLERVGGTRTHRLVSPLQQAEMGIDIVPLPANGGLADPAPSGAGDGLYDRPWGATLALRLFVEEGMKALGARYYRISLVASDGNGQPVSGAVPLPFSTPRSWSKIEYVAGLPVVVGESLGPETVNGENGLYKIPYWSDAAWLSNQYHQVWNTASDPNGRHLTIVEIFDQNGNRLKPTGTGGAGTAKNFDYLHWREPDAFDVVSFAALTHVFWTDNTPVFSDIEDLRKNHSPNTEECQFMTGGAGNRFSVGFRSFHVNGPAANSFMWNWRLLWRHGLNGAWHPLDQGTQNVPATLASGSPQESATETFGTMLAGLDPPKCAFSVQLRVRAKHTNGSSYRLEQYDRWDNAAFALEIGP